LRRGARRYNPGAISSSKIFDKIERAAPTRPVLSAVRLQPSNNDSLGPEPVQARSRFASLPTGAELLLVGVVVQLLPIPSYSILSALLIAALAAVYHALWPKTVIPFIGILSNKAAKSGHVACFYWWPIAISAPYRTCRWRPSDATTSVSFGASLAAN
jgi:hypothetical protein